MIEYIPQALTSLSHAANLTKVIREIKDSSAVNPKLIELENLLIETNRHVLAAQAEGLSLLRKVDDLEKECVRLRDWFTERENLESKEIGDGVFAYVHKENMQAFQSAHKLCCGCFNKTVKSTLQQSREPQRMIGLVCPNGCPKIVFTHYLDPQSN